MNHKFYIDLSVTTDAGIHYVTVSGNDTNQVFDRAQQRAVEIGRDGIVVPGRDGEAVYFPPNRVVVINLSKTRREQND